MNTRNHFKFRFLRAALMLTLAVMTFPTVAWAGEDVKYLYYDTSDKAFKESTQSAEPLPTSSTSGLINISGWYYVKGNVSISKKLTLTGDTHIILCDDANLIINVELACGIYGDNYKYSLSVYAQSNGSHAGAISVTSSKDNAIFLVKDFTIHGGKVSATTNVDSKSAVYVWNDFTIYGGQLNATANGESGNAIFLQQGNMTVNNGQVSATANGESGNAIFCSSSSATLTVNGGKLTATALDSRGTAVKFQNAVINGGQVTTGVDDVGFGGDFAVTTLTLGWTNASDFFKVTAGYWNIDSKWKATKSFWIDGSGILEAGTEISPSQETPTIIGNTFDGKKFTPKTDAAVYNISVGGITDGTVETDKEIAFAGEKVTLSVTPDEGRIIKSVSCSDGTNDIPVTNEYGKYTFVMPAANATVTATFAPTPYAVLSEDGKTLTFKCGVHTLAATNEWDVSDTGTSTPGWIKLDNIYSEITSVVFDESFADARPKSCNHWFYMCGKLTTITGLNYLNTSEVTDMAAMFCYCLKLTSLDLSSFNTSKVTDMTGMFQSCHNLTSLDLSSFNTSKVTKMFRMFQLCSNLTSIDLSSFDTREVTDMNSMFCRCSDLTSLNVSTFDTGEVTDMSEMFSSCISLKSLAIGSDFTVFNNVNTTDMFNNCTALAEGMLIVNGTTPPTITKNIFSVFTNGTLATNLTKNDLGITGSSSPFNWKGGKFKSVGAVKIPYIDENGKLHNDDGTNTPTDTSDDCADALPITSVNGNVSYGAGWYFVAGNVNINGELKFTGDAHIILCDGAKMTVTNTSSGAAIYGYYSSLAIYGQSTGNDMGSLTATGSGAGHSIYAYSSNGNSSVTINGGQVTAIGGTNGDGILAYSSNGNSSVIINGGQVNATGGTNGDGIQAYSPNGGNSSVIINGGQINATGGTNRNGIQAYSPKGGDSSVTINGGQVTAIGGTNRSGIRAYSIDGDANITLSWTSANDYIYANGYSLIDQTENMKTAAGKRFVAYDAATGTAANCIIGDASSTTATAIGTDISLTDANAAKTIAGKTLRPLNGYTVSTTDDNISLKDGTTAKTPDFTITTTSYYIYPANTSTPATITLSYSGEVPTGYAPVYTAKKTSDGTDVSSTVISGSTLTMPDYDITISATVQSTALGANGYEAVDLGLPSGLLWATCNVGATTSYGYGDYFAWGETTTKNSYDWNSYKYSNGDSNKLTKYCKNESDGYNNFTDNLSMLEAGDDAAKANWGGGWRMPTKAEWEELIEGTEQSLIKQNGVDGVLFTATNGNTLFLPAAGRKKDNDLDLKGDCVHYWSSTMNDEENIKAYNTTNPAYETISREMGKKFRYQGLPVRAVITKAAYTAPVFDLSFTPSGKFSIAKGNASVYVGDSTDPAEMKSGTETLKEKVANGTTVTLKAASGYKFKSPRGEHLLTVITPTGSGDPTPKYSVEGVARLEMEDDVNCSNDHYWYSNMPTEMGKLKVTAENGYSITRLLVGLVNPCENIPYKEIDGKKYYDMPSLEKIYITDGHAIYYSSGGDITIDNSGVSEFRVYGYKKDEGVLGQLSADGTEFSFTMPSDDTVVPYELEGLGVTLSVPAQQFITYCSDQALTLGDGQSDAALYTISKVGTDAVTLSAVAGTASAGTPLLVWNGNTTAQDIFLGYAAAPETETAHADEFKGTTTTKEFSADDMMDKQCYVLAGGKMFVRVEGAGTIAAHRCWLELPNSNTNAARSLVIIGNDDEPTSIENVQWSMVNGQSDSWYDLQGRKLEGQPKRKGVYIHNGKKIAQSRRER